MTPEIRVVDLERLPRVTAMLGRAFVDEPMMRWPLGDHGDLADRFARVFAAFDAGLAERGFVWEAGDCLGAACWIPPGHELLEFEGADSVIRAMADDGGRRWNTLWEWAGSKVPEEPVWYLDHIGVEPGHQGGGVGTALVEHGLVRARADGVAAFLEVGNPRNVAYYERFGFTVVEAADAPDGGPHVWFMRREP